MHHHSKYGQANKMQGASPEDIVTDKYSLITAQFEKLDHLLDQLLNDRLHAKLLSAISYKTDIQTPDLEQLSHEAARLSHLALIAAAIHEQIFSFHDEEIRDQYNAYISEFFEGYDNPFIVKIKTSLSQQLECFGTNPSSQAIKELFHLSLSLLELTQQIYVFQSEKVEAEQSPSPVFQYMARLFSLQNEKALQPVTNFNIKHVLKIFASHSPYSTQPFNDAKLNEYLIELLQTGSVLEFELALDMSHINIKFFLGNPYHYLNPSYLHKQNHFISSSLKALKHNTLGADINDSIDELQTELIHPLSSSEEHIEIIQGHLRTLLQGPVYIFVKALQVVVQRKQAFSDLTKIPEASKSLIQDLLIKPLNHLCRPPTAEAIKIIINLLTNRLEAAHSEHYYASNTEQLLITHLQTIKQHDYSSYTKIINSASIAMYAYKETEEEKIAEAFQQSKLSLLGTKQYFKSLENLSQIEVADTEQELANVRYSITETLIEICLHTEPSFHYEDIFNDFVSNFEKLAKLSHSRYFMILQLASNIIAELNKEGAVSNCSRIHHEVVCRIDETPLPNINNQLFGEPIQTALQELSATPGKQTSLPHLSELLKLSTKLSISQMHDIINYIAFRSAMKSHQINILKNYHAIKATLIQAQLQQQIEDLDFAQINGNILAVINTINQTLSAIIDQPDIQQSNQIQLYKNLNHLALLHPALCLKLLHITALQFSYMEENTAPESYAQARRDIALSILEQEESSYKIITQDAVNLSKTLIKDFLQHNKPLDHLKNNHLSIQDGLKKLYNNCPSDYHYLCRIFDLALTYADISKEDIYNIAPQFQVLLAPQRHIQALRALKIEKRHPQKIIDHLEEIALYFEQGLYEPNPRAYFENNKTTLMKNLQYLQYSSDSLWDTVRNIVKAFICTCLSLFGTPDWLEQLYQHNLRNNGDRHLFFANGLKQRTEREINFLEQTLDRVDASLIPIGCC